MHRSGVGEIGAEDGVPQEGGAGRWGGGVEGGLSEGEEVEARIERDEAGEEEGGLRGGGEEEEGVDLLGLVRG